MSRLSIEMTFELLSDLDLNKGDKIYLLGRNEVDRYGNPKRGVMLTQGDYIVEIIKVYDPSNIIRARGETPMTEVGTQVVVKKSDGEIREYSADSWYGKKVSEGGKRRSKKTRKSKRSSKKTIRRRR